MLCRCGQYLRNGFSSAGSGDIIRWNILGLSDTSLYAMIKYDSIFGRPIHRLYTSPVCQRLYSRSWSSSSNELCDLSLITVRLNSWYHRIFTSTASCSFDGVPRMMWMSVMNTRKTGSIVIIWGYTQIDNTVFLNFKCEHLPLNEHQQRVFVWYQFRS